MDPTYKDPTQPIAARVEDLLGRMTLEEKVAQLGSTMLVPLLGPAGLDSAKMAQILGNGIGHLSAPALMGRLAPAQLALVNNAIQQFLAQATRLGIPAIVHNEALAGLLAEKATTFPTAIGLAATWQPALVTRLCEVSRRQARAVGIQQALSPVLDIARDARWGRVHETYGEDPYLVGAMGRAFVKGLQGDDLRTGVMCTGKHFLGYGLSEGGLNRNTTHLGPRELYDVFARPFEAAIKDSGLGSIMNSYSDLDGVPCGANRGVLTDLLRGRMGFEGAVVSDYFTLSWLITRQHTAANPAEAAAQALEAGLDVELPATMAYGEPLISAVAAGAVAEDLVDRAVRRVLAAKFELGLFENPFVDPAAVEAAYSQPDDPPLAHEVAARSFVLLKNDGLLPLRKDLRSVALIGPHADSLRLLYGGYTFVTGAEMLRNVFLNPSSDLAAIINAGGDSQDGDSQGGDAGAAMAAALGDLLTAPDMEAFVAANTPAKSVRTAITALLPGTQVAYAQGCALDDADTSGIAAAVRAAEGAEVAIVVLGSKCGWVDSLEGEGFDRASLDLPGVQQQLLEAVVATGTPVVLVLLNGRPLSIPWAAGHVPAILEAWLPGEAGGAAIAATLFGDACPGGKLPITFPRSAGQTPIYHYHRAGSGYTDRAAEGMVQYTDQPLTPLYPFGHGLSYTRFEYADLRCSAAEVDSRGSIDVSLEVTNCGTVPGDEVVQLYVRDREARVARPVRELAGFTRTALRPGETRTVTFTVPASLLAFTDEELRFVVEPGNVDVMVGSSSEDIRLRGEFRITGEKVDLAARQTFVSQVRIEG